MSLQDDVLAQLSQITDPDLGRDIVSLGFVKDLTIGDDGAVSFALELTTPACPVKDQFREQATRLVEALPWVKKVSVTMTAQKRQPAPQQAQPGMAGVQNIIAVSSCKGGVGKSTVAVNLAFSLAKAGAKVGIFDSDLYGPSLPTMVRAEFRGLQPAGQLISPVMFEGVAMMSFGYATAGGPAIVRGPMATNYINQLLGQTAWGDLDYLVIDMPPGTGDIQLTLCQVIPMTAAVIVTTPQEISFVDVVKGIQMFDKLRIPTVAVVENMSYFMCPDCDSRHHIFGGSARRRLVEEFGFQTTFELPLDPRLSATGDAGMPMVLRYPDSEITTTYRDLGNAVVREVSKVVHGGDNRPEVSFEAGRGIVIRHGDAETVLPAAPLRRACRCAGCINEITGEKTLRDDDVSEDIQATTIRHLGNYAITIDWSDGHRSIFPYSTLEEMTA